MAKKNCPPKKKPAPKGLAAAAASGGGPLEVSVKRMSMQLPLRDLFAAFALAGNLAADQENILSAAEAAGDAYHYADAMMRQREAR